MTSSISTHSPDTATLALAIVDTVREPLLVLDKDLRVVAASRSFYLTFKVASTDTVGRLLYALGDGQWDIPRLRLLLENIVPERGVMDDFEVEHQFPGVGRRTMLLNARNVFYEGNSHTTILLGIEDVTARRALERDRETADAGERYFASGNGASSRQQPANHRGHNSDEVEIGDIGGDPHPPAGRSQSGHLGSDGPTIPPCFRRRRNRRNGALFVSIVREPEDSR